MGRWSKWARSFRINNIMVSSTGKRSNSVRSSGTAHSEEARKKNTAKKYIPRKYINMSTNSENRDSRNETWKAKLKARRNGKEAYSMRAIRVK